MTIAIARRQRCSAHTADCLALANTAILLRLIEEPIDCGMIGRLGAFLQNAMSDLQGCTERSSCVDDAIIRKDSGPFRPEFLCQDGQTGLAGSVLNEFSGRRGLILQPIFVQPAFSDNCHALASVSAQSVPD
jgi:hypothetical protein